MTRAPGCNREGLGIRFSALCWSCLLLLATGLRPHSVGVPMSGKRQGLFHKYNVTRVDGKPIKGGCIVLEWDDPNALVAIAAFARRVSRYGYPFLGLELENELRKRGYRVRS